MIRKIKTGFEIMLRVIAVLFISLFLSVGVAAESLQPLSSEKAFVFTTYVDAQNQITFQWNIAPGYYLYQNKFRFSLAPTSGLQIGKITWPSGLGKKNINGVSYPTYSGLVKVTVPLLGSFRGPLILTIDYQGCSLSGFCYAPIKRYLHIDLNDLKPSQDLTQQITAISDAKPILSDQEKTQAIFAEHHSVMFILLSFLGIGLLLAFTPCVLPMIPILSGIIVGHKRQVSTKRAFSLSFAYVMGMALTYAVAGMIVAILGSSIQAFFQKTAVIVLFSGVFVLLSLSLFGLYDLQLPGRWQNHITRWSHRFQGGTYISVFLMGCISTLIVSPCVSAPLVGVLAYIAQTGNALLGAAALLMLGVGMGMPLLVIGTSAGKWMPKAGHWMELVKKLFGVLMLSVAIWMLSRVIPGPVTLFLWSLLCMGTGIAIVMFYKTMHRGVMLLRIAGTVALVYGIILMIGAALGNTNPLAPWDSWNTSKISQPALFIVVHNQHQLEQELQEAKQEKKPVIMDFYADWCVTCVLMDQHVFTNEKVREALSGKLRLRIDVTNNDKWDREVMQRYHVVAPPTMLFFDDNGDELSSQRIVGEVNTKEFLDRIKESKRAK
jgi:thioredoxin:protein disulfide reductase